MVAESIKKSKGIFIKVRLTVISNRGSRGWIKKGEEGTSELLVSLKYFGLSDKTIVIYFIILVQFRI